MPGTAWDYARKMLKNRKVWDAMQGKPCIIQETGVHIVYPFVGPKKKGFCVFHLSGNSLTQDTMNSIASNPFNNSGHTFV